MEEVVMRPRRLMNRAERRALGSSRGKPCRSIMFESKPGREYHATKGWRVGRRYGKQKVD